MPKSPTSITDEAAKAAALVKTTVESTATALYIQQIQKDVLEIKISLKELSSNSVSRAEYNELVKIQVDHETRTRNIEQNMWKWIGISSGMSAILATIIPFISKLL